MTRKFEALPHLSSECCIYRVPERLRSVKEKAYTPQVVSIGPLHHGKDGLKAMEEHKRRYLYDYIQRTGVSLDHYINIVRDNESKLRSCYEETIGFNSDEFVEIILVDSVFIIEVLLRECIIEFQKEIKDLIFQNPWMINDIWPDLQLLENQLPFFILEQLFDPNKIKYPTTPTYTKKFSIFELSCKFITHVMDLEGTHVMDLEGTKENQKEMSSTTIQQFVNFLRHLFVSVCPNKGAKYARPIKRKECERPTTPSITELDQAVVKLKVRHFVDFMRYLFVSISPNKRGESESASKRWECKRLPTPSITELDRAGVKFKVRPSKNLLDIHFEHGILRIPKLRITDGTESTMRNLAAFEQCHYANEESYICHYLKLLDDLVNTEQDVDLLVKKQIIENWLGESKNVSDMMNKLGVGILIDPKKFYFGDIFYQLDEHYNHTWNHWKASLKQNYFNTPWAIVSVIAAVLIIILTVIQAVCSIISVI